MDTPPKSSRQQPLTFEGFVEAPLEELGLKAELLDAAQFSDFKVRCTCACPARAAPAPSRLASCHTSISLVHLGALPVGSGGRLDEGACRRRERARAPRQCDACCSGGSRAAMVPL